MLLTNLTDIATIAVPLLTIGGGIVVAIVFWTKVGDKMDGLRADGLVFDKRLLILEQKVENMQPIWEEIRGRLIAIETQQKIYFDNKRRMQ